MDEGSPGSWQPAPGTQPGRRIRWELIGCGLHGHALVGADAAEVRARDAVIVRQVDGVRWCRCLRCDGWFAVARPERPGRPVPPDPAEIEVPLRGRPLRERYVLRLIALDRLLHVLVLALAAAGLILLLANRAAFSREYFRILRDLQGGTGGPLRSHGLFYDVGRLVTARRSRLLEILAVVIGYALLEAAEAVGLWFSKRWAEYLTFIATAALAPFTVYELVRRATALKALGLAIDLAIVVYLLLAKRLFGVRGGGRGLAAERAADSGWGAVERATPTTAPAGP